MQASGTVLTQMVVVSLSLCLVPISVAQGPSISPNRAHGSNFTVEVGRVVSYGSTAQPLYEVTVTYSFDELNSAWIRGVGIVPSKGSLSYFSSAKELEFRGAPRGASVVTIPIEATFFPAANGPLFPEVSDFHSAEPAQVSRKPLQDVTIAVLNALRDFANIPPKTCPIPWEENCLLTAWISLPAVRKPLVGQVAVMVTYVPSETAAGSAPKTTVKVLFEERESLVGSGVWRTAGDEVRSAAKERLGKLSLQLDKLVQ